MEDGHGDRVGRRLLALGLVFVTYEVELDDLRNASSIFCGSKYLEVMLEKLTTTERLLNAEFQLRGVIRFHSHGVELLCDEDIKAREVKLPCKSPSQ